MKDQRGILSVMTTIAWLVRNVHWRKAPRRGPGIWADWRKRVTYLAQSRSFWSNLRQSGLIWTNLANRLEIVPARAPFGKGVKNMQENLSKVVFSRSVLRIVWGGTWNTLQNKAPTKPIRSKLDEFGSQKQWGWSKQHPTTQQHLSVIVKAQGTCSTKCQHHEVFFGKQINLTIVDERSAWDIVGNDDNSLTC